MIDFSDIKFAILLILPKWIVEGNTIDNVFMSLKSEFLLSSFSVPNLASSIVGPSNEPNVFLRTNFVLVMYCSYAFCCVTYHHSYWTRSLWEEGRVLWEFYTARSVSFSWIRFSLSALLKANKRNKYEFRISFLGDGISEKLLIRDFKLNCF